MHKKFGKNSIVKYYNTIKSNLLNMGLSNKFKSILWEYDISKLCSNDKIVVERVLNLGEIDIFKEWLHNIGKDKAKKLYLDYRGLLDKKSANYYGVFFGVNKSDRIIDNRNMYDKLNTPIFSRNFG